MSPSTRADGLGEGLMVLLISHDVEQVLRMASLVLVMRQGSVVGELETEGADGSDIVALITGAANGGAPGSG